MSRSPAAGLLLWARPVVDMDRFSSIAALPALRQYGAQQHVRVVTRAFEFAIRSDSLCESIRLVKKSAFRFTSCRAVFSCLFIVWSQPKNKLTSLFAAFNTLDVFNLLEIV